VPGAPGFLEGSAETYKRVSWVLWIYQRDKSRTVMLRFKSVDANCSRDSVMSKDETDCHNKSNRFD
jgi:hypothetical protein